MDSDVTINVTVTDGGQIDADLTSATVIETTVVEGGQLAAEVTGGGKGDKGDTGATGATGATGSQGPQGDPGVVQAIVPGNNIDVDETDPTNPVVSVETLTKADVGLSNVDNTTDADKPVSTAQATAIGVVQSDIDTHEARTDNPHSVTKSQVGLANADNTSDANKPVSTAQQTALDGKQNSDADLTAIAGLDSGTAGAIASDGAGWIKKTYAQLKTALGLVKGDVGLGNVDNTSDANKPVSTATQTALDLKENIAALGNLAYEDVVTETEITLADNTTNDFSTTKHGFVPKGPNTGKFLKDNGTWESIPGGGDMLAATYDPQAIAADAFDQDNMTDGTTNKNYSATEKTKLAGIETAADVTDATNVAAAGATMDADTSMAGNGYFLDEDNFASDSATKVASQQSIKAYVDAAVTAAKSALWPVGSIYTSINSTNPGTSLGFGTWVAFGAGRVPVGFDSGQTEFDTDEETGGAKTHTLTTAEIPAHNHEVNTRASKFGASIGTVFSNNTPDGTANTANTGGGGAHNNLQPYIVVRMWKRTA